MPSNEAIHAVSRIIHVNCVHQSEKFCTNEISTSKYSVLSFFPRFLLEQFRRYNNIFFLIIALLQQIPNVSPTGRYTTAVPFLIILAISALKEIFEDVKRRRMDHTVNNYATQVLKNNQWEEAKWKKVAVGEIVKVEDGQLFPADLILLSSSEPQGMAYIETSNLDGETNLKIRQGLECTSHLIRGDLISQFTGEIECEPPSRHVSEYTGTFKIENMQRPLGPNQLLLRGARLKNTHWIFGVVVYTGHDAKLLMNSKAAPLKRSNVDTMTNHRILFLFFVLVSLAIISAVGAYFFDSHYLPNAFYLKAVDNPHFAWNVLTFFILYNNLIPISLQVTLELVRFFQASYINCDIGMYHEPSDTSACARTSNLNEELGQVKFVMSDKTGTLTRNVMKFKRCTVGGVNYGNDQDEAFADQTLLDDLTNKNENAESIREFLTMMAVCHTIVPEYDDHDNVQYQGSSPDEGALVRGAASMQFVFHTRRPQTVIIKAMGTDVSYEILNVLEFTSDRKRMGVIVRTEQNELKLFIKGADNVIMERLALGQDALVERVRDHLIEYASLGYRTLCFASAQLDEDFYSNWATDFHNASIAIERREELLVNAAEAIEKDLKLVGATAIEDKLQEHVPVTIRALMAADIRVWMLTGDKRETAINIAQSSALCTPNTNLLILDKRCYDETYEKLVTFNEKAKRFIESEREFALVLDGGSLHHALTGESRPLFAELAMMCRAVVCCRMTPMQKAEVVEMVRSFGDHVVLAIGDGANDVAMIQAANVGIGISGEEGLRAASASDYSIAQFHYLRRLLLVHGAWNFDRSVKVILYSFYKNICLYIIELWFAFFSAFSGQTIFERWTIGLFNVLFTAWPPVILGLFDRPVSEEQMLRYPALYCSFQRRAFSTKQFCLWVGMALWHSLLLFFLTYGYLYDGVAWSNGRTGGWLMLGNTCYTMVVATVCLKALLECDSWTWVIAFFCIGSTVLWFIFFALYSLIWPLAAPLGADMSGMARIMMSSGSFWLAFLLIPATTLITDVVLKGIRTTVAPSPRDLACISEKNAKRTNGYFPQSSRVAYETNLPSSNQATRPRAVSEISETRVLNGAPETGEARAYGSTEMIQLGPTAANVNAAYYNTAVSTSSLVESNQSLEPPAEESQSTSLTERARLLRARNLQSDSSSIALEDQALHGYAFSQEEGGAMAQTELIRNSDSTVRKPQGL
ncbi:hypothetical protein L596_024078 [Steinernema carpocapsae]|uniref:Phospholipid-transporting ATPase n=1 Tax=Steinernema carpocapsae TaxID=34508 RepID=A0A4U5MFM7_STECR|nr:hypothetical protein L596_024078 [Steinernema carpocapsae]